MHIDIPKFLTAILMTTALSYFSRTPLKPLVFREFPLVSSTSAIGVGNGLGLLDPTAAALDPYSLH
jgi:hypothetical protein